MAIAEDGARVVAPDTQVSAVGEKPSVAVKLSYSLGQVVESSYLTANTFVFFYYTAVLGLSGSLVGLAVAISMCLDAALDPLIGSWSDNVRSKLGRRLPVMLIGAPLAMLTMGLMFAPPGGLAPLALFAWLTLTKMGVRAFASMYNIPYFALGGEMSDDYAERTKIVAWRLLAGIVVSLTITALAYSVFFAGEGGLQRPDRYPEFGWTIGVGMVVFGVLACLGMRRFASGLPQPPVSTGSMLSRIAPEIAEIFRNRSFVSLFLGLLAFASAAGIHAALNNHNFVFVWKLRPGVMQVLSYTYLAGITLGVPITPLLLRRMEKKHVVGVGFVLVALGWIFVPVLRATGLFTPTGAEALPWLAANNLVVGLGTGLIFVGFPSMMADAADEHEHLFDTRREGLYFAGLGFAGKAAAGIGTLVGGFALDALHFPREVGRQVNAVISEDVLASLVLAWGPLPAALALLGGVIFAPYAITRARHEEITQALRRKRAAAAG